MRTWVNCLTIFVIQFIAIGVRMLLGMQDFDFAQILGTFTQILPEFAQLLSKFTQILTKFAQKNVPWDAAASLALTALI